VTRQVALAVAGLSCLALLAARPSTGAAQGSTSDSVQTRLSGSWHLTFLDSNAESLDHQQVVRGRRVPRPNDDALWKGYHPFTGDGRDANGDLNDDEAEMQNDLIQASLSWDEKYFNAHSKDFLAPIHLLNIAAASRTVAMVRDAQSSTFDVTGQREKQSWASMAVTVKSTWTTAALVQDILGDHHLSLSQVFQPSPDGQTLTVTLRVRSPRFSPPISAFTRTYVREPAAPPVTLCCRR
jgi:hypothetical protein